ncbi:FMN-binding protein [Mycoplasma sp. P36-A1]|uniref:FMN-binding protein n=1 Tax=Mycoplasma sp. P36-A1 TaxID=3252900 RepID=UPI003C2E2B49
MKKIVKLAVFLSAICILASAALYFVNDITSVIIQRNTQAETNKLLAELYPDAEDFEAQEAAEKPITGIYKAVKGKEAQGTVYEIKTNGFQSEIAMLLAINTDGSLGGMKVISQAETPGYGTQITTNQDYINQYTEKTVNDEIDTITGSTVTTSAVKTAVDAAIANWKSNN